MTELGITGGYVRHRDRMIQESVFQDVRDTLIACRWLDGTTAQPVWNPQSGVWEVVTTAPEDILPLLEGGPVHLIDYFPEAEGSDVVGEPEAAKVALNTLALDSGTRSGNAPMELGNRSAEYVLYRFNMALYASSDAVAQALMNDLADRYKGRLVRPDFIDLWDFNSTSTEPVVRMSAETFTYVANDDRSIQPHEVHLYFGELILEDQVD